MIFTFALKMEYVCFIILSLLREKKVEFGWLTGKDVEFRWLTGKMLNIDD